MFSWKEEDCTRYAMRWGGCPFLFDKDLFFPVKDMPFEDLMVMVPARVSDYLIWHYGDEWAYVPNHEERTGHDTIEPPDISYQEFRSLYQPRIGVPKIQKEVAVWKGLQLMAAKPNHRVEREKKAILSGVIAEDVKRRVEEMVGDVSSALKERRFDALSKAFSPYFSAQLSSDFVGREDFINIFAFYHPTLIPLKEDLFIAALWTLLYTERLRWADALARIYLEEKGEQESVREIRQIISRSRASLNAYEQGDFALAREENLALCKEYPENPSFEKFHLKLLYEAGKRSGREEDWRLFEQCLNQAQLLWPKDGFIEKYQADFLLEKGKNKEAIALYHQAILDTTNGITWLEAGDLLSKLDPEAEASCEQDWREKLLKNGYPEQLLSYRWRVEVEQKPEELEEKDILFLEGFGKTSREVSEAHKLLADVLLSKGEVHAAFARYREVLETLPEGDSKEAVCLTLAEDLMVGARRYGKYARRRDASAYLEGWIGKYGTLADIQRLDEQLSGRRRGEC